MPPASTPAAEAAIWARVIEPESNGLPRAAARALLRLTFSGQDKERMNAGLARHPACVRRKFFHDVLCDPVSKKFSIGKDLALREMATRMFPRSKSATLVSRLAA